jgi:hypothetical protein
MSATLSDNCLDQSGGEIEPKKKNLLKWTILYTLTHFVNHILYIRNLKIMHLTGNFQL